MENAELCTASESPAFAPPTTGDVTAGSTPSAAASTASPPAAPHAPAPPTSLLPALLLLLLFLRRAPPAPAPRPFAVGLAAPATRASLSPSAQALSGAFRGGASDAFGADALRRPLGLAGLAAAPSGAAAAPLLLGSLAAALQYTQRNMVKRRDACLKH